MPFGGWFDVYYKDIFCPAIEQSGLEPHRADDLFRPSAIIADIWDYTKRAKIMLADLTGKNPNVFYELGLAHALSKPVILLTESLDDVPFDLKALRIIEYDKNLPEWGKELKIKISSAIKEVLEKPNESVPATFLKSELPETQAISRKQEEKLLSVQNEINSLRRILDITRFEHRQREFHRPSLSPSVSASISPSSVQENVRRYLEMGMPEHIIVDRLLAQGIPSYYTLREISFFRSHNRNLIKKPKKK